MFIFFRLTAVASIKHTTNISGLSLSCQSNGEKLTRFKITADTLMTFARDFFFPKKETDSRYNVIPIEVSFCIHGTTKLYGLHIVLDRRDHHVCE